MHDLPKALPANVSKDVLHSYRPTTHLYVVAADHAVVETSRLEVDNVLNHQGRLNLHVDQVVW